MRAAQKRSSAGRGYSTSCWLQAVGRMGHQRAHICSQWVVLGIGRERGLPRAGHQRYERVCSVLTGWFCRGAVWLAGSASCGQAWQQVNQRPAACPCRHAPWRHQRGHGHPGNSRPAEGGPPAPQTCARHCRAGAGGRFGRSADIKHGIYVPQQAMLGLGATPGTNTAHHITTPAPVQASACPDTWPHWHTPDGHAGRQCRGCPGAGAALAVPGRQQRVAGIHDEQGWHLEREAQLHVRAGEGGGGAAWPVDGGRAAHEGLVNRHSSGRWSAALHVRPQTPDCLPAAPPPATQTMPPAARARRGRTAAPGCRQASQWHASWQTSTAFQTWRRAALRVRRP